MFLLCVLCAISSAVGESGADGILPLRASAFLLLATLCAVLGVRAFPRLPRFFPAMLQALESQTSASTGASGGGHSLLWTSALSAVATVAASLPSFLSPYLGRILAVALRPAAASSSGSGSGGGGGSAAAGSKQAADRVLSLVAAGVEPRLLVPAVCSAYAGCVEGVQADEEHAVAAARSVARLLAYVQEVRTRVPGVRERQREQVLRFVFFSFCLPGAGHFPVACSGSTYACFCLNQVVRWV